MINKRAQLGHGMTWLWKFMILVLVVGGVVAVVVSHYSKNYDIRDIEASLLSRKIVDCIAPNGILHEFDEQKIRDCMPFNEQELYLNISLDNKPKLELGSPFLATLCQSREKTNVRFYPSCLDSNYHVITQDKSSSLNLKINLAIRKTEKNL